MYINLKSGQKRVVLTGEESLWQRLRRDSTPRVSRSVRNDVNKRSIENGDKL